MLAALVLVAPPLVLLLPQAAAPMAAIPTTIHSRGGRCPPQFRRPLPPRSDGSTDMTPSFLTAPDLGRRAGYRAGGPGDAVWGALVALRRHIPTPCARETGAARGQPPPTRNHGARSVNRRPWCQLMRRSMYASTGRSVSPNGVIPRSDCFKCVQQLSSRAETAERPRAHHGQESLTASCSAHKSPSGALVPHADPVGPRGSARRSDADRFEARGRRRHGLAGPERADRPLRWNRRRAIA